MLRRLRKSPSQKVFVPNVIPYKYIFLSVLSGIILVFPFANGKLWIAAWFGFVPLFFALKGQTKGRAFLLAYLTGIIFWFGTIYWLIHVTLAGLIILVLYLALYFGIFGLIIRASEPEARIYEPIFVASLWVILEFTRSYLLTGFPWALLGYSQYLNLPVIQMADITGAWGVSFLVMMMNKAIYGVIVHQFTKPQIRQVRSSKMAFFILFIVLGYGYYKLNLKPEIENAKRMKVSVIQGNIPQELKWDSAARSYILDKFSQLTKDAAKDEPDLIIWPEAASPEILGEENYIYPGIFALSKEINTSLLLGALVRDGDKYFNSALFLKDGKIAARYNKLHLVPFGEYIPLKKFLPFLKTIVPIADITAGKDYTIFQASSPRFPDPKIANSFAVLICFEDVFPELSRNFIKKGADFLVNITNDAWYKLTSAPYQHLQASVFRALENRAYLVRCANTGVSAFIAPTGQVFSLAKGAQGRDIFITGFMTAELNIPDRKACFYNRFGNVSIAFVVFFFLYGIILKYRKPK